MRKEHPLIVATIEALARRMEIQPEDLWAYLDRRRAPPPELRDALVAAFFPRVPPESFLTTREENSTIATMATTEIEAPRLGRPLGQGKLPDALRKAGVTHAEAAAKVKRSRASLRSWALPKSDPSWRPAPRAAVDVLKAEYGIPLSTWTQVEG